MPDPVDWGREIEGVGEVVYRPADYGDVVVITDHDEQDVRFHPDHLNAVIDVLSAVLRERPWSHRTAPLWPEGGVGGE